MQPKRIAPIDINYILVEYEQIISKEINLEVVKLAKRIESSKLDGIISIVPTYSSLLIEYDPLLNDHLAIIKNIKEFIRNPLVDEEVVKNRLVRIPVFYGKEKGPDLADVARINELSEKEVISIHKNQTYRVYMLGFNPGFPYMGGLDKRIATPRLNEPRTKVPAGSVAIGGEQTGVYSITSPGGWRLIGHTPLELFNPKAADPTLLRAGDDIIFYQVDINEYSQIEREVMNGTYKPEIEWVSTDE